MQSEHANLPLAACKAGAYLGSGGGQICPAWTGLCSQLNLSVLYLYMMLYIGLLYFYRFFYGRDMKT